MQRLIMITALIAVTGTAVVANDNGRAVAHQFKEAYWNCLAQETVRVLPRKMAGPDFLVFIQGRCPDERKQFRTALVDFLAREFPTIAAQTHLSEADRAIQLAIEDAASAYVDLKSGIASQR
jgi:hypothetical protein